MTISTKSSTAKYRQIIVKLIVLSFLVFAVSCTSKNAPFRPGHTKKAEILLAKGEPDRTYEPEHLIDTTVMKYKNNEAFQLRNGILQAQMRDPVGDEKYLNYWLNRWDQKKWLWEQLTDTSDMHMGPKISYRAGDEQVFLSHTRQVDRIVVYEK